MRYFTFFKSFKPGAYFAFIAYLSLDSSSDIFEDSRICSIMGFSVLMDASATHTSLGMQPLEPINFGKTECNYVLLFGLQCPSS